MAPYALPLQVETARLRLSRPVPGDAVDIFARYAQDPAVTRYLGWRPHGALAETEAYLAACDADWEDGRGFPMVMRDSGGLVGMIHPHVRAHGIGYGYVLAQDAWGQGYASEALTALVEHALAHPSVFRTEAFCDAAHGASARVMEKAGMVREGLLRRWFVHPAQSDTPRDCWIYARVR